MQALQFKLHRAPTSHQSRRQAPVAPRAFLNKLFGQSTATPASKTALNRLLSTIDGTNRGQSTSKASLAIIKECFEELEASGPVGTEKSISGTWRLVWTTEKETLFILKNAGLFGTNAGEVFQVIDTAAGTLQNVIEFPPEGAFIVNSSLEWEGNGSARTNFKFNGAVINLPDDRQLNLPPVGKGWFESVYCDGKYRLARDVRGDYLVVVKDGPPREFS
jgi:PAP_fibrillin